MRIRVFHMLLGPRWEKVRAFFSPWSSNRRGFCTGQEVGSTKRKHWNRGCKLAAQDISVLYTCFLCPVWYFSSTFDMEAYIYCLRDPFGFSWRVNSVSNSSVAGMARAERDCLPTSCPLAPLFCSPFPRASPVQGFILNAHHLACFPWVHYGPWFHNLHIIASPSFRFQQFSDFRIWRTFIKTTPFGLPWWGSG